MPMSSNDAGHFRSVTDGILVGVPSAREVFPFENLATQVRMICIDSGVDNRNGYALSLGFSPDVFYREGFQRSLLVPHIVSRGSRG